jgi:hypothetical protein
MRLRAPVTGTPNIGMRAIGNSFSVDMSESPKTLKVKPVPTATTKSAKLKR